MGVEPMTLLEALIRVDSDLADRDLATREAVHEAIVEAIAMPDEYLAEQMESLLDSAQWGPS